MSHSINTWFVSKVSSLDKLNQTKAKVIRPRGESLPEDRYRRLKELGLCVTCGKDKGDSQTIHCGKCKRKKTKS